MTSEIVGKINSRTARIVVVGIGYVGLPLVVEFARAGFRVTGYDKDPEKARLLNEGESYIGDISSGDVAPLVRSRLLDATTDASVLREADVVIVCVPTPLNKTKEPDMRFIVSATDDIVAHQHAGMLVVLESTTYPGTTRELVCPRLSESGVVGRHTPFTRGTSQSRQRPLRNEKYSQGHRRQDTCLPGSGQGPLLEGDRLGRARVEHDAAEMVKLLENTFRAVNIGLVNEFAVMCHHLGVDYGK